MKKYIGYRVETGMDLDFPLYFMGFITYFNGEDIIIERSERFEEKESAWKWIADTLKKWENDN